MKKQSTTSLTTRDFLTITWEHKKQTMLCALIPVSSILLNTFVPLWIGKILAALSQQSAMTNRYVAYLVLTSMMGVIFNHVGFNTFFRLQPLVMAQLDKRAFAMLLSRSTGFHSDRIGGKLVTDTVAYANAWQQLSNAFIMQVIPFVLSLIIGIGIVTASSWTLGLLVFIMTVTVIGVAIRQTMLTTGDRLERHNARRAMIAHLSDTIVNHQTVKTFAAERRELTQHAQLASNLTTLRVRDWGRLAQDGSKRIFVLLAFEIAFILLLIRLVHADPGLLAIGIFTFSYALNLGGKLFDIGSIFRNIEDAYLDASDTTKSLHESPEILDAPNAKKLVVKTGSIELTNVSFTYDSSANNSRVFKNLTLSIGAGERVGLVGHSGGGKSTFTKLMLRFEDIQAGTISIDEQNIATVTQESLRNAISYVPQEPLLFHRSISENIAYGQPHTTLDSIKAAARNAHADEFISGLASGYDTVVGERGIKLSGGQRQRVAIARAMLKDAPILLLDEATSALDSESEKLIQDALWRLMEGKTAVVIAHRLSTIQKMDRIVVLDDGAIVEQGSHNELLAKKGAYAKLWTHQSGGFIEE